MHEQHEQRHWESEGELDESAGLISLVQPDTRGAASNKSSSLLPSLRHSDYEAQWSDNCLWRVGDYWHRVLFYWSYQESEDDSWELNECCGLFVDHSFVHARCHEASKRNHKSCVKIVHSCAFLVTEQFQFVNICLHWTQGLHKTFILHNSYQ